MSNLALSTVNRPEGTYFTIFVGSLSEKTTQASVHRYFSKFGHILASNLITDWTTGTSKRCAIVFISQRETYCKILGCVKHILDGKKIRVAVADQEKKGTKKISTNNLFVGNIPSICTEGMLRCLFQKFGMILVIRFFRNISTKPNTKNAIVEFTNSKSVETAFKHKANLEIEGSLLKISPLKQKKTGPCHNQEQISTLFESPFGLNENNQSLEDWDVLIDEDNNFVCNTELLDQENWSMSNEDFKELITQKPQFQTIFDTQNKNLSQACRFYADSKAEKTDNQGDSDVESPGVSSKRSANTEETENCSEELAIDSVYSNYVTLIDIYGDDEISAAFFKDSPLRKQRLALKASDLSRKIL